MPSSSFSSIDDINKLEDEEEDDDDDDDEDVSKGCDKGPILLRKIRLIELTDGTLYLSHILSCSSLSRISHANMPGSFCLYSLILPTTLGVVTRGLLPPIAPGNMLPVSWYLAKILLTQPCDTLNCRLMSHGLTPKLAISTMRMRILLGNGRPFTNTPPSWFTSP